MGDVYDVHTHVGTDYGFYLRGWWPYASTAQDLLAQMHAHGVGRAVCFPFTLPSAFDISAFARDGGVRLLPDRFPFDRENDLLAAEIERIDTNKRLLQFAMFDPAREVERQPERLQRLRGRIAGPKPQTTIPQSTIRTLTNEGPDLMRFAQER